MFETTQSSVIGMEDAAGGDCMYGFLTEQQVLELQREPAALTTRFKNCSRHSRGDVLVEVLVDHWETNPNANSTFFVVTTSSPQRQLTFW